MTGWLMFAVATIVYMLTAEPTASLWDCGEFISAAHKLEVVHPPGAPLFLMIGRMFAWVATVVSDNPSNIAYALNVMSGVCTAFLVMFVCWSTIILSKLAMVGRNNDPEAGGQTIAILASGVVAALATTFATSVWFSAVEGEVYAMSSGFSGLVMWASLRWYVSDHPQADRWLVFIAYMMGLSIGVHLLSLLAFPFLGVLFYYKQKELKEGETDFVLKSTILGFLGGFLGLVAVQYFIIPRLPQIAAGVDYFFVNEIGLPMGTGVLFFLLLVTAAIVFTLRYAHKVQNYYLHLSTLMVAMILIGFSSYGMVVVRANAQAAINMNNPSDPYSMLSYLNREQYGTRPLLYGPHFAADHPDAQRTFKKEKDVYRPVEKDGKMIYDIVDEKQEIIYGSDDMMLFPRLGHLDKDGDYKQWMDLSLVKDKASGKLIEKPTMMDNLKFFFEYQIGYMYLRYFSWNFIGRQNAYQGIHNSPTKGNWISGIGPIDAFQTHTQRNLPDYILKDKSRNTYYFLPFIFGLIGLLFHISKRPREAAALGVLFLMTGLAIIVFTNQPPREPRERDYVIVGSVFTFCIWIGMAVPAIYEKLKSSVSGSLAASLAGLLVLTAPVLMGFENWDDHSRAEQYGARDYAINFLESCAPNALVFTYGDNDTYPLWYAQEVENIRPDVRVINFSLLAVDWYINQLRRDVNTSTMVEMTIPKAAYRGRLRNYLPFYPLTESYTNLHDVIKIVGDINKLGAKNVRKFPPQILDNFASIIAARNVFLPVDKEKARANGAIPASIPDSMILNKVNFSLKAGQYMMKDEIALMDIISTNAANGWKRPIYFAVTCRPEKIMGLKDYLMLEGMALRIVPYKTPSQSSMAILMGKVDTDLMYENMVGTEEKPGKFKWGGFDKKEFFINESYMPSVHSLQYGFIRLTDALMKEGKNEKAVATVDKFFEAFPHFNFPYEQSRMGLQAMQYFYGINEQEKAHKHIKILSDALYDRLVFYMGLSDAEAAAFAREKNEALAMTQGVLQLVNTDKDVAFKKEITEQLKDFIPPPAQQNQLIGPNNN